MSTEIATLESTEIGKHYAADLREGLESLLLSWNVEVKEAA